MKKLLIAFLMLLITVSCCQTTPQTISNDYKIVETVYLPSTRIDIKGPMTYFYEFEYKGHQFITAHRGEVFYHLPSCPCHNSTSLFNNTSAIRSSLFD